MVWPPNLYPVSIVRVAVSKWTPGSLRALSAAALRCRRALEEDRARIQQLRVERPEIGRRIHARNLRLVEPHRAPVVLHRHDRDVRVDHLRPGQELHQLADGEAVAHCHRILSDERSERRVENVALDAIRANRIGPVEDDHRLLHGVRRQRAGPLERVHPRADVLNVVHEHVDVLEHVGGRRLRVTVE
jgi:hypothetical protein